MADDYWFMSLLLPEDGSFWLVARSKKQSDRRRRHERRMRNALLLKLCGLGTLELEKLNVVATNGPFGPFHSLEEV
jgi:hypothetical protein